MATVADLGAFREMFLPGAFGDVSQLDTTLNVMHQAGTACRSHWWRWRGVPGHAERFVYERYVAHYKGGRGRFDPWYATGL